MTRKSSIPESILQYVPCKCCRLRNDGDVYRVYKYSAIKLPSGKWSSNYGYLIGKILPEKGFFPNKRYLKEMAVQDNVSFPDEITDVAYGQYALLMFLSQDILKKLETYFPRERAIQIYIVPIPSTNSNFKRIKKTLAYTSGEFIYKSGKKNSARIVYYEEKIDEKTRIIVYKDEDENNSRRKSYKQMMDLGESNYTQENYDEFCDWWGVYFIQTTASESASEIYSDYKGRWSIETFNNYVKNDAEFNNLKIQDYYVEHGFDFIMLVTGLIHSRLNETVKNIGKSSISTFDLLVKAGHMRMVLEGTEWKLHNTRTKDLELLEKTGFTPKNSCPATAIEK